MTRKLFLMLGAPASGKDTWIEDWELEDYAITPDVIRKQIATPKLYVDLGTFTLRSSIKFEYDHQVWKIVEQALKLRMQHGDFAIVNGTHLYPKAFKMYDNLSNKYHYKVYVIDVLRPICEELGWDFDAIKRRLYHYNQSSNRDHVVPESVIDKYLSYYFKQLDSDHNFHVPYNFEYVNGSDDDKVFNLLNLEITDMSKFKRIKVIGDVHGDMDALSQVFADHQKGDAYVFVGDYLDRGTKSVEVFDFITQTLKGSNLFFIRGNHEVSWEYYQQDNKEVGQFAYDSLPKLKAKYSEKELKLIIKDFSKHLLDYLAFNIKDNIYIISHAGIEPSFIDYHNNGVCDQALFTNGLGLNDGDPYNRDVDTAWSYEMPSYMINIHGHRNNFNHFCDFSNAYNLTDNVNNTFRWLVIDQDNHIEAQKVERTNVPTFVDKLQSEEHIKQTKLDDGIVANNFDREAFSKGIWNHMTTRARGLFTRGDDIVGRGFDKFFNIGQTDEARVENLEFPVTIEKKWNGFLGITFWDKDENTLRVYSKAGNEHMSKLALHALKETGWYNRLYKYYGEPQNQDTTVLFEIIDPALDPHIIMYGGVNTMPLAIIKNGEYGEVLNLNQDNYDNAPFRELQDYIYHNNVVGVVNSLDELNQVMKDYLKDNPIIEGFVLYGHNMMLKYKTPFYLKAKELRSKLEKHSLSKHENYYYGAQPWVELCKKKGITKFTPQLALDLYNGQLSEKQSIKC